MNYIYYTEDPEQKQGVLVSLELLVCHLEDPIAKSDRYRAVAEYPEFPEVSLYPFKKGDRVFFVGICHSKKWLNHWCAKGIKIAVFCNDSRQFPLSREHQWNGALKLHLSEKMTIFEMIQHHLINS